MATGLRELLGVPPGRLQLAAIDTRGTPGAPGGKAAAREAREAVGHELATLQEQLHGMARVEDSPKRLLLILQGMDTSGKDGAIKRGLGGMNPSWMHVKAFDAPTDEELEHDFLWRIRREAPAPGVVGVFDRSHYEDVLVVRVRELAPEDVWRPRF